MGASEVLTIKSDLKLWLLPTGAHAPKIRVSDARTQKKFINVSGVDFKKIKRGLES